jgi:uncharacterized protein (DUF2267 family)
MTSTGVATFDKTLQETQAWLDRLMEQTGIEDRHTAYAVLRATLHALRDRIGPENAVHLGAQLPILLRGVYYEGWRMTTPPTKERHIDDFIGHVLHELAPGLVEDPREAVWAALGVARDMVDPGEAAKLAKLLPAELREFWQAG